MKNNFVVVVSILISVGIFSCTSHSKVLSIHDFTALYVDSLKRAYPDDRFLQADDSTVYEISQRDTGISAMENVYHHYRGCPDSLGVVLHNRLLTKKETQQRTTEKSIFMPVIKSKNYMKAMIAKLNEGRPTPDPGVYEEYNGDLVIAYVVNTNYAMKYLNRSDLDSLKLSFDSLRTIAFANLRKLLPSVKIHGSKVFMPVVEGFDNGTFEATLLLLPDFILDSIPVKVML